MPIRISALFIAIFFSFLSVAFAGGESDVFVRLSEKLTASESTNAARFLLRNSLEVQAFSRKILGSQATEIENKSLAEAALERLQKEGRTDLAEEFESRINRVEKDLNFEGLSSSSLSEGDSGLKQYRKLLKTIPDLENYFPKSVVYQQLAEEELVHDTQVMAEVFNLLGKEQTAGTTRQKIRAVLRRVLFGKVPSSTIPERIRSFLALEPGSFTRAMGSMTLEEVQLLVHGGNPLKPTADSLLGQYLHETGATTAIRTFEDAAAIEAGKKGARGPKKLVVSVSAESYPAFEKLILKRKEWMSVFSHAFIVQGGQVTTFEQELSDFRLPRTEYTPFPMVLLKTTEADRLAQYLEAFRTEKNFADSWDSRVSAPWRNKGYCATSAWADNCTQHIGNMPIGDSLVTEYTMPGEKINKRDPLNPIPIVQSLRPFKSGNALLKRVWKTPGNMQFAEVLGQKGANLRGEFANPGWLISTLLGPTSVERVPIVFVVRPDHTLPIDTQLKLHMEDRI